MPLPFRQAAGLLLSAAAAAAPAATYTVTKTADTQDGRCDADCSLREAISAANGRPGQDSVVLGSGSYRLSIPTDRDDSEDGRIDEDGNLRGDLDIRDALLLRGKGGGATVIDAAGIDRAIEVLPGVTAEIRDLEIRRGRVPDRGAGIANAGDLSLLRVRLRLNQAASGFDVGDGGGVFNEGRLRIADSQLRDNSARGGEASSGEGGGIYNTGSLEVRGTLFTGNLTSDDNDIGGGGAVMNRGGTVLLERCYFEGNSTSSNGYGGAVANHDGGQLRLVNSTVSGNSSGERGSGGGAVSNGSWQAPGGSLYLNFVTIADNDGGGVFSNGDFVYYDSLIAGNYENFGSAQERQYAAGVNCISLGFPTAAGSIVGLDGQGCRAQTYVDNASALSQVIHPLANNGGFAPTHALRDFDPAYDSASLGGGACPPTDQRGARRPADGDGDGVALCDIGAFERNDDD